MCSMLMSLDIRDWNKSENQETQQLMLLVHEHHRVPMRGTEPTFGNHDLSLIILKLALT